MEEGQRNSSFSTLRNYSCWFIDRKFFVVCWLHSWLPVGHTWLQISPRCVNIFNHWEQPLNKLLQSIVICCHFLLDWSKLEELAMVMGVLRIWRVPRIDPICTLPPCTRGGEPGEKQNIGPGTECIYASNYAHRDIDTKTNPHEHHCRRFDSESTVASQYRSVRGR